jgi:hypothetical protein
MCTVILDTEVALPHRRSITCTAALPMKKVDSSHLDKKVLYGKGFQPSSYHSLLVPGTHKTEEENTSKSSHTSPRQAEKLPRPSLNEDHRNLSSFHPELIESGKGSLHAMGGAKLRSLEEARSLIDKGAHPTLHKKDEKVAKDNTAYRQSIDELKFTADLGLTHVSNAQAHINELTLRNHPNKSLIHRTKHLQNGIKEMHTLATTDHPHEMFPNHDPSKPLHETVKQAKLAAIDKDYLKISEHIRKHS